MLVTGAISIIFSLVSANSLGEGIDKRARVLILIFLGVSLSLSPQYIDAIIEGSDTIWTLISVNIGVFFLALILFLRGKKKREGT